MELSEWFGYQLRSTLDGFIWAVHQVPEERLHVLPPTALGEWSAAQHVFHMLDYEERLVLPSMSQWLGVPPVIPEESETDEEAPSIEEILSRLERVRQAQMSMLPKFNHDSWGTVM